VFIKRKREAPNPPPMAVKRVSSDGLTLMFRRITPEPGRLLALLSALR
jgi:hypothetical protein